MLAELLGTADAVLFPSGFQLNVGVIPALVEPNEIVYSDRLNHASLIDGLRLASGHVEILDHLKAPPISGPGRWWITESIFSMDGDRVDLAALAQHRAAGGMTYVDEAHSFGLFGGGRGLCSNTDAADVIVGTLSKAYGCAGAFAAGSAALGSWIRNRARSYVFSTGPTPRLLPDLREAIEALAGPAGDHRREKLWTNVRAFADALGLTDVPSSPIIPIIVGPNAAALDLSARLLDRGWHVQAIRPPTVPEGTARLRITLSAMHTEHQLAGLAKDLRQLFEADNRPLRVGAAA
jgi:7-keto-8-aminopelargonate synthetase-like enzyme